MPISSPTLLRNIPIALLFGVIIAVSNCYSDSIHLPIFVNTLLSVIIGWLEPRKGWILAFIQGASTMISYFLLTGTATLVPEHRDIADFATYISIFPTLSGSFIGGFIKRAFN